jgi:hypothetical protein
MITKKLNRRQARWVEFLAEFDFKIAYQSEKKNDKTNSLTRRSEDRFIDESDDRNKHIHQTILSVDKVDSRIVQKINNTEEELSLFDRVKTVNQNNRTCNEIRKALQERRKSYNEMILKRFKSLKNTLFFKEKLWMSESNQLKLDIIREIHHQSVSEHLNIRRIHKYLSKWYYWSQAEEFIQRYVANCHVYKRSKVSRDKYFELLNSLLISNRSWTNIIINFVTKLSKNKYEFNFILMMINWLTKMHHYISCVAEKNATTTEETTRLLINHVWKLHDLSSTIVSDRESQFVSFVWKTICQALKINVKLSIAFHFETNEQSEIANLKMKRYLRSYCNYQQNDWFEWLFMTEFASNVATSTFIELFVFMTNYEYESRMNFDSSNSKNVAWERLSIRKRVLT